MIIEILIIIIRFIILAGVQVLVLNNLQLGGLINPYLYVLFLLTLPVRTPRILMLFIALTTGLVIDMFMNTMGMHAAACLLLGFVRPSWLKIMSPRDGYETDAVPGIRKFGFQWFLVYSSVMVLVHHTFLFYIEVFRFSEFFYTFLRVILSSIVTMILIIISHYLFSKPEGRNK